MLFNKIMEKKKKREVKNKENDFFFDDCPICQAMKMAEKRGRDLSPSELKDAFQRAKNQGRVVGGEWFDEDK
jgi:hypothetical protein